MIILEACCGSVEEALAAQSAGADRIELCAALPTGGVTPSVGMIEVARENLTIPIVTMVRPKEGVPTVSDTDFRACIKDVEQCIKAGADEIICGFLNDNSEIDIDKNRALIEAADGVPVAFHRVFDMTHSLSESLETIIELGFVRVLTSGGEPDVDQGIHAIKSLVNQANGRITILPGGGVREHNVRQLVDYAGCKELHFSFRKPTGIVGYGGSLDMEPDPNRISEIRRILAET